MNSVGNMDEGLETSSGRQMKGKADDRCTAEPLLRHVHRNPRHSSKTAGRISRLIIAAFQFKKKICSGAFYWMLFGRIKLVQGNVVDLCVLSFARHDMCKTFLSCQLLPSIKRAMGAFPISVSFGFSFNPHSTFHAVVGRGKRKRRRRRRRRRRNDPNNQAHSSISRFLPSSSIFPFFFLHHFSFFRSFFRFHFSCLVVGGGGGLCHICLGGPLNLRIIYMMECCRVPCFFFLFIHSFIQQIRL